MPILPMPILIKTIEAPWGDYGHILQQGMSIHLPRVNGIIQLERTGPDIYPITIPFDIIVTAECKRHFERSSLTGATFKPVIKSRIVDLDWSDWDVTDEEPPEYPDSGEPEGYILSRPHSEEVANSMPDLFEMVLSEDTSLDVFHLPGTWVNAVSKRARNWFTANYGDYVAFDEQS